LRTGQVANDGHDGEYDRAAGAEDHQLDEDVNEGINVRKAIGIHIKCVMRDNRSHARQGSARGE
jgi:hypothetical protein